MQQDLASILQLQQRQKMLIRLLSNRKCAIMIYVFNLKIFRVIFIVNKLRIAFYQDFDCKTCLSVINLAFCIN